MTLKKIGNVLFGSLLLLAIGVANESERQLEQKQAIIDAEQARFDAGSKYSPIIQEILIDLERQYDIEQSIALSKKP